MSLEQTPLEMGAVLENRYRLISQGTSQDLGTVYKAHDMQLDQLVVLLVLAPIWRGDVEAVKRLKEVQRTLTSLAAPGLVPFEHVGLSDGQLFLVHTRTESQTLADALAPTGRLDIPTAVELAISLCKALAPAHRAGLVHGSLSPHSVLVTKSGDAAKPISLDVHLVDVGLLPAVRPMVVVPDQPWGRMPYISPEQAAGQDVHPTSDVYVIGSLLYEMLTGRPPFRASDETVLALQHLRQDPPALQVLVPHVPPALAQIVHKALAKEPSARYRNAGQLAHILNSQLKPQQLSRQVPVRERLVVPPPPAPSPAATWSSRETYYLKEGEDWSEESPGVDWLMIGLLVAALIAVLGLIPLWRTVYRRYATPPPASAPASYFRLQENTLVTLSTPEDQERQAERSVELDDIELVWYHSVLPKLSRAGLACQSGTMKQELSKFGSPAYGFGRQNVVHFVSNVF